MPLSNDINTGIKDIFHFATAEEIFKITELFSQCIVAKNANDLSMYSSKWNILDKVTQELHKKYKIEFGTKITNYTKLGELGNLYLVSELSKAHPPHI